MLRFFSLAIILLFLNSCTQVHNTPSLRLLHLGADPKTFNPWIASDATSSLYAGLMYEGLIKVNPADDSIIPALAENIEILNHGLTIIAHLRKNIYWSDGKEITADDVLFTWNNLIRDGIAQSSLKDILDLDGSFPKITKIDNHTIVFQTDKIFAPFVKYLGIEIAPKHDIENFFKLNCVDNLEKQRKSFNNYLNIDTRDPVVSGPYKIQEIRHGQRIKFYRNPKYYSFDKSGQRLPYIDSIIFTYVQEPNAAVFKFLAQESDLIELSPSNIDLFKSLQKKYKYKLKDCGISSGTSFLWFNLSKNVNPPQYDWFNDKNFRKAINFIIDREAIVKVVYQNYGQALFTAESLRSPFVHKKLSKGFKPKLKMARQLLLDSGFYWQDGLLYDARSNRVEFTIFTNAANPDRELIAVMLQKNLADFGIKINIKLLEFNNFVSRIMQGKDYEAGILSLTGSNEPNGGANVWKSTGRLHLFDIKSGQQKPLIRDWESEIDNLFIQGVRSIDLESRAKIYNRFQEIIAENNPIIYLASPKIFIALSPRLDGTKFDSYESFWLNLPRLRFKSL